MKGACNYMMCVEGVCLEGRCICMLCFPLQCLYNYKREWVGGGENEGGREMREDEERTA